MNKVFGLVLLTALLSACDDGIPKQADPHHPVDADGKPMKGTDFIQKYCVGKEINETCERVHNAVVQDSVKGEMPKGY